MREEGRKFATLALILNGMMKWLEALIIREEEEKTHMPSPKCGQQHQNMNAQELLRFARMGKCPCIQQE